MRRMYCTHIIILLNVLFLFSVPSIPGICADPDKTEPVDVKKMEETIKKQEAMIKQLQSEINEQRDGDVKAPGKQPPQDKQILVEQALRDSWGCCGTQSREVKVTEGTVSIYFNDLHDIISFFDKGAEGHARADHAVFLKATGLERGTIEYYTADQKKRYSISGSLAQAKTEQYY